MPSSLSLRRHDALRRHAEAAEGPAACGDFAHGHGKGEILGEHERAVQVDAGEGHAVGRGHSDADMIDRAIETADRSQAGPTLPPQGLWLEWIEY